MIKSAFYSILENSCSARESIRVLCLAMKVMSISRTAAPVQDLYEQLPQTQIFRSAVPVQDFYEQLPQI